MTYSLSKTNRNQFFFRQGKENCTGTLSFGEGRGEADIVLLYTFLKLKNRPHPDISRKNIIIRMININAIQISIRLRI